MHPLYINIIAQVILNLFLDSSGILFHTNCVYAESIDASEFRNLIATVFIFGFKQTH